MADHEPPTTDDGSRDALAEIGRKLDTVAGALAAVAGSHTDLLAHVAEAEARRSHDAREVAQRLVAIERQILALPTPSSPPPVDPLDPFPAAGSAAALEQLRADVALTLAEIRQLTSGMQRLEARSDDRLATLGTQIERIDVAGPLDAVTHELTGRLTLHTDTALAGALRVIDDRLAALRTALAAGPAGGVGGFEAGAVMGAAQAAWNRLEQRLDAEFDDLGRQLQAMAALIEQTAATTEAVANRPVVTGDQLRRAAASVKDSVVGANRARRDRRGGPRGLGSGTEGDR